MPETAAAWTRLAGRLSRRPLVLLLDVDGTLAPIASRPEEAAVPEETRELLDAFGRRPDVHVALVSGRAAEEARAMIGVEGIWTIGNHGLETIDPDGRVQIDPRVERYRERLQAAAARLSESLAPLRGVQVEDKWWTLSIHYRRAARLDLPRVREAVEQVAADFGLRVTEGKKVLELRPPVDADKGTASLAFVHAVAGDRVPAVLYAGDDRTDEDAFVALRREVPDAITIRVAGPNDDAHRTTSAEVVLPDIGAVRALLERLLAT